MCFLRRLLWVFIIWALSCVFSVISPIDGKSMESITSVKIFHGSEFKANGKVIRWTEVRHTLFLPHLSLKIEAFINMNLPITQVK